MFKRLSTGIVGFLGILFALYMSSWCFHIMNFASNFAVFAGVLGLLVIWVLVIPFFFKRIYNSFKEIK